jgi:hypothetical protein
VRADQLAHRAATGLDLLHYLQQTKQIPGEQARPDKCQYDAERDDCYRPCADDF